jgi:hypothetical protein
LESGKLLPKEFRKYSRSENNQKNKQKIQIIKNKRMKEMLMRDNNKLLSKKMKNKTGKMTQEASRKKIYKNYYYTGIVTTCKISTNRDRTQ